MDDKNNNMEEFFKRSLERFDELPSDDVWKNISDRLAQESHWYDPILSILKTIYPFLVALLIVGLYHLHTQRNLRNLNAELIKVKSTIQKSQNENKLNETENIDRLNTESFTDKSMIEELTKLKEDLKNLGEKYHSLLSNNNHLQKSTKENSYTKKLENEIAKLREKLTLQNIEILTLRKTSGFENLNPGNKINAATYTNLTQLPRVGTKRLNEISPLSLSTKIPEPKYASDERIEKIMPSEMKRFKFGLNLRYFSTLVKNSTWVNPGFSQGLRLEYAINSRWGITSNILYNSQAYNINAGSSTISKENLQRYPGGIEDNTNVNNIYTRSRYLDTSLGIKYSPSHNDEKFNFFVNPAVVWQLYLPQEYQYYLLQEANVHYRPKLYTAYLGSGNLSMGIEKKISQKITFQMSMWGEQSFIPLGYDKQYVTMFGASSAIIF